MKEYDAVITYIKNNAKGRGNVTPSKTIEGSLGIPGSKIRAFVNEARQTGIPICSCSSGYYYSDKEADVSETILHLRSRISKVEKAIDGLSNLLTYGLNKT